MLIEFNPLYLFLDQVRSSLYQVFKEIKGNQMNSSKLNRTLTQFIGIFLGIAIAVWLLRGLGILTNIPGGIIWLLLLAAIFMGIISYIQKTWWRF